MSQDCLNQAVGIFEDNRDTAIEYKDLSEISETDSEYLASEVDDAEERVNSLATDFKGTWDIASSYTQYECVEYNEVLYVSLVDGSNTGNQPDISPSSWVLRDVQFIRDNYYGIQPLIDLPLKNSLAAMDGAGSVTFERDSTATYIDHYGVVQTAAIDEPRFEKEGLLLEGGVTNYQQYTSDPTEWSQNALITINSSTETAPDGTSTACEFIWDNLSKTSQVMGKNAAMVVSDGDTLSTSVFVKHNGQSFDWIRMQRNIGDSLNAIVFFDILNGTVGTENNATGNIKELADGWFRVEMTFTMLEDAVISTVVYQANGDNDYATDGDGVSGYILWGTQLEETPFATSYIEVPAATPVEREQDFCSVPTESFPKVNSMTVSLDLSILGFSGNFDRIFDFNSPDGDFKLRLATYGYRFDNPIGDVVDNPEVVLSPNTKHNVAIALSDTMSYVYIDSLLNRADAGYNEMWRVDDNFHLSASDTNPLFGHVSNLKVYDEILHHQTIKGI